MEKQRILITVKTYPTLSKKYGETVCTAGVREDGAWVRIYPVPFRRLGQKEKYKKYDWVECRLRRNTSDPRPESFRPFDEKELCPIDHIDTANNWNERRQIIINTAYVYNRLDDLITKAKSNEISLAVFKPSKIIGFKWEKEDPEWDPNKVRQMRNKTKQLEMFADDAWRSTFKLIPKLPYSFSYKFKDAVGRTSELEILDWEIGALYWKCLQSSANDEQVALSKVKEKYFDKFTLTDLHFFLGTTQQYHLWSKNPWVIIGVLPIPFETQIPLL
jgi:Fe-S-cluster formation regulator IscX/YfhJ